MVYGIDESSNNSQRTNRIVIQRAQPRTEEQGQHDVYGIGMAST